ncbi:hypothetical protein ACSEAJ_004773, partial [Escherichia coli]
SAESRSCYRETRLKSDLFNKATNNVGCKDVVVDGETGYLCNVRDYIGLANVMRKFIELTPQERETMGKKGRDYIIKNFDERKIIKIYHDTLTKYIS